MRGATTSRHQGLQVAQSITKLIKYQEKTLLKILIKMTIFKKNKKKHAYARSNNKRSKTTLVQNT